MPCKPTYYLQATLNDCKKFMDSMETNATSAAWGYRFQFPHKPLHNILYSAIFLSAFGEYGVALLTFRRHSSYQKFTQCFKFEWVLDEVTNIFKIGVEKVNEEGPLPGGLIEVTMGREVSRICHVYAELVWLWTGPVN
jgi:hypothetical protein